MSLQRIDLGDGTFRMWDPVTNRLYPDGTVTPPAEDEQPRLWLLPPVEDDSQARAALERAKAAAEDRVRRIIGLTPMEPEVDTGPGVYIAGPMRGIAGFNFAAFDEAADILKAIGYTVCNPADRDREAHGDIGWSYTTGDLDAVTEQGFSLREALAYDTDWISRHADAVAVLPGWEASRGARAEVALAHALGILVAPVDAFTCIELPWHDHIDTVPPLTATETPEPDAPVLVDPGTGEVRTRSATGGEKCVKPARYDLIPQVPLDYLARMYGRGAEKYDVHNWRRGYEWSKSFAAMQRHLWAFWSGEDTDPEMQLPHLAAAAFHTFALLEFSSREDYARFDDRYRAG
jgi:hypothetical protein